MPLLNFLFIMAQDRILGNTTENVIANMKIKNSMFYKKKLFFYDTHSLMKWKKKSHKILKRIATCWSKIVLQLKNF